MKRYYLQSTIIDSDDQLEVFVDANKGLTRLSGIQHTIEVIDVPDGRIALVFVDDALIQSGEYKMRMAKAVENTMHDIFDMMGEAVAESRVSDKDRADAAAMTANFFNHK